MNVGLHQVDSSALQGAAGVVLLVVLFVIRAFVSGALTEAGKDAWIWLRKRRKSSSASAACRPGGARLRRGRQAGEGRSARG